MSRIIVRAAADVAFGSFSEHYCCAKGKLTRAVPNSCADSSSLTMRVSESTLSTFTCGFRGRRRCRRLDIFRVPWHRPEFVVSERLGRARLKHAANSVTLPPLPR
jgi:hypothetical protein